MEQILKKIKEYNTIIIHGHKRPDGDCLGSQFGLKDIIKDDFMIKSNQHDNTITYSEEMSVSELEKQFADKLKLSAQIFRKSGRIWLETTFTDSWSLKKQNQEGMELSQL